MYGAMSHNSKNDLSCATMYTLEGGEAGNGLTR